MKKAPYTLFIVLLLIANHSFAQDNNPLETYPNVVISNGLIDASVFLPDCEKGFYRSTRFEWSGMIWQLIYNNHTYFTDKNQHHNPETTGHSLSLAEEFSIGTNVTIPQRFKEAKPGETFMKIGVGNLEKPDGGGDYHFSTQYNLVDPGVWTTSHGTNWVEFTHTLDDDYGYGYIYQKRMELVPGEPALVISHSLTNTGSKPIREDQYNHNFFTIDHLPIGNGYRVERFFGGSTSSNFEPVGTVDSRFIVINRQVEQALFGKFRDFDRSSSKNHVIIRHSKAGTGVDITGDFTLSGFNFYASSKTICPEMFVLLEIALGETQSWSRTYTFFTD